MDKTNHSYDLVIVGGGIIGLLTAFHSIVQYPQSKICIIEKEKIAAGTTSLSVALCSPVNESEKIEEMYRFSRFYYEKYSSSYGLPLYYKPIYSVTINPDEQRCEYGQNNQQINDVKHTFRSKFPIINLKESDTLLYRGNALFFEIHELVDWLRNFILSRGGILFEDESVAKIDSSDKSVSIITNKKVLHAENVVVSIGKYISHSAIENVIDRNTSTKKIIAFKHPLIPTIESLPVISFPDEKAFIIEKADGIYVSLTSDEWNKKHVSLNELDAKLLNDFLQQRLNLKPADFEGVVGADNYTDDKAPSINFMNDHNNIVVVEGASGRGVKLGFYMAYKSLQLLNLTDS